MQRTLMIGALLILITSCSSSFLTTSKKLSTLQNDKGGPYKALTFHEVRKKLHEKSLHPLVNDKTDTLFLLEQYVLEDGVYYGTLWNNRDTLVYTYSQTNNEFQFPKSKVFPKLLLNLIASWDTATIRKLEMGSDLVNKHLLYGSRIINREINTMQFKEFFINE